MFNLHIFEGPTLDDYSDLRPESIIAVQKSKKNRHKYDPIVRILYGMSDIKTELRSMEVDGGEAERAAKRKREEERMQKEKERFVKEVLDLQKTDLFDFSGADFAKLSDDDLIRVVVEGGWFIVLQGDKKDTLELVPLRVASSPKSTTEVVFTDLIIDR